MKNSKEILKPKRMAKHPKKNYLDMKVVFHALVY